MIFPKARYLEQEELRQNSSNFFFWNNQEELENTEDL